MSKVIAYHAQNPAPAALKAVSDTLAAAYFAEGTPQSLRAAYAWRPQDIAINYALWQAASTSHTAQTQQLLVTVQEVAANALATADPSLLRNTIALVPTLYSAGIWDRATTSGVARYFIWRHPSLPEVASMLQALVDQDPGQYDWSLLLAELNARLGAFERAENLYSQVFTADSSNWQAVQGLAYSRLELAQSTGSSSRLADTARMLENYLATAPDDIALMELLQQIYLRLGSEQANRVQMQLDNLLDDRSYVADRLGIPVAGVRIGDSLVANGNLRTWKNGAPEDFDYYWSTNVEGERQPYFAGFDPMWRGAARIIGLSHTLLQQSTHPYAEYVSPPIDIDAGQYLVTFSYCMPPSVMGEALVYLGQYGEGDAMLLHESVPGDIGGCRTARYIVNSAERLSQVRLLARNWGVEDLRILELSVRPIEQTEPLALRS